MEQKRKRHTSKTQAGFSIVEMLAAIGIFSFLLLISADSFWKTTQQLKEQEKVVTRNRIFQNLIYMIGLPSSTRAALENAGEDSPIWKCVKGGPCESGPLRDLVLFLPPVATSNGTDVITSGAMTGPPSAPLRYSMSGEICDASKKTCEPDLFPISVSTQFDALCPPRYDYGYGIWPVGNPIYPNGLVISNNCWAAHYIKIIYRFEPTPGAPTNLQFTPVTGSLYVNAVAMRLER